MSGHGRSDLADTLRDMALRERQNGWVLHVLGVDIDRGRANPPGTDLPGQGTQDRTALTDELGQLAQRLAGLANLGADQKAALAKLAGAANAAIKGNDLTAAAALLAKLQEGIGPTIGPTGAGTQATATKGPDPKVAFAQARLRYEAGRKHVRAEVEKLAGAMREFFAREPDFTAISNAIEAFDGIRDLLDERLIDELDAGYSAGSEFAVTEARAKAQAVIAEYQEFLSANARLLNGMDSNPFVPVSVESVLPPLLADLAKQLQPA